LLFELGCEGPEFRKSERTRRTSKPMDDLPDLRILRSEVFKVSQV